MNLTDRIEGYVVRGESIIIEQGDIIDVLPPKGNRLLVVEKFGLPNGEEVSSIRVFCRERILPA